MHATSPDARVVSLEERDGDGVSTLVDVDVIEDVAGLDAAPEEDREGLAVVTDDHLVERGRVDPGHPGRRFHLLCPVVRIGDHGHRRHRGRACS